MKLTGKQKTRLIAIAVSALVAVAAGQVMQSGSDNKVVKAAPLAVAEAPVEVYSNVDEVVPLSAPADAPEEAEVQSVARAMPVLPEGPDVAPLPSTDTAALAVRMASLDDRARLPAGALDRMSPAGVPCDTEFTATAADKGTVLLTLSLPCATGEMVTISHEGLRFTVARPATGEIKLRVPALSPTARFAATLGGGARLEAEARVPEAAEYDHVALQWRAGAGMQLHAFEFGADYGKAGHVWAGAPLTAEEAAPLGGGFLMRLGDGAGPGAQVADIYSFPRALAGRAGVVRINIEAEVTPANCGKDVTATALQPGPDGRLSPAELVLSMPGCDAVGEYLVLKNVVRDLKLAGN
ncbi:hypothetical protein Ga0609869_001373 [Rhodovulum iodosum]|uniref:Translocase n=1 Tax=Rhodovulum iodosum TaxID=68291 RepID=A0ABV3XTB9_9RHOB|nr:hypothetical protein [Rhodovulum robiginosum]RSK30365.1 hypothetical protein EJA01_16380 [Rhodovulum robiginosum]